PAPKRLPGTGRAENQIRMGKGRLSATAVVTSWAGCRARALRADSELASAIDPADAAAAGANGEDVDRRDADWHVHHMPLMRHRNALARQQTHVKTGAAHVGCDAVFEPSRPDKISAGPPPAARSRKQEGHRHMRGALGRGHAAVRLHHPEPRLVVPGGDGIL